MIKVAKEISTGRTIRTFLKVGSCSETLCNVLDSAYGHPRYHEEHGALPFAGGILQKGHQCGVIWGAVLGAGAQAYRKYGAGPDAELAAVLAAQQLARRFVEENKHINCLSIIEADWYKPLQVIKYFLVGKPLNCFKMTGRFAQIAYEEINSVFSNKLPDAPDPPVSCAALMSKKMGVSDLHTVMAAGFAGGIGLSGNACGALGTAIWTIGMDRSRETDGKIEIKNPKALETMNRFLEHTCGMIECSEIVGRKFESAQEHSEFVRDGGCAALLDVLAEQNS